MPIQGLCVNFLLQIRLNLHQFTQFVESGMENDPHEAQINLH